LAISPQFGGGGTRKMTAIIGIIVMVLVLAAGAILYATLRETTPGDDSAEAGFLRDMQVHHDQAVVMADTIRFRTDDDQIYAMATDIAFSQTSQIGSMKGFLDLWNLNPTGKDPAMAWMGHPTTGLMPGMATPEQVEQLSSLPVEEAEVLFMQLMNRHHFAGIEMAEAIIERSDQEDVVELAESMVRTQSAEVEIMNQMLVEREAEPVTSSGAEIDIPGAGTPVATPTGEDHQH